MRVAPDDRHLLLTELRESIRRIERRPARRSGVAASGLAEVDEALPDGGFPRGALSELSGGRASGKTAVALSLLASLGEEDLFAWVDARGELYPPAAAARGVDLGRLLIVRPGVAPVAAARLAGGGAAPASAPGSSGARDSLQSALWAAEALLGSAAFAAVVVDVPLGQAVRGWDTAARRLQAAAEKGGAVGLWLAAPRAALRVPAALRLELWAEGARVRARRVSGGMAFERTPRAPQAERRGHVA
jgi:protein ImuA